jgi:predicted nuclease of predicted toxin-antitoxin system
MSQIKLLLDEDVWPGLAIALQKRGFEAQHVRQLERDGLSDAEQLAFAARNNRAILTHNAKDFIQLASDYFFEGRSHSGIILARQMEKGKLIRDTLNLLQALSAEAIANTLRFLTDYEA